MKALLEFQKKVSAIKKDGKNPHFKSTYATLTHILSEVKPVLSELGLILLQPIKDNKVLTIITDGDKVNIESWLELPLGLTPQQICSAVTYYRRYTLASLLALEIFDDDANLTNTPLNKALETLNASNSLDDLVKRWGSIGKEMQSKSECISLKESLKAKYSTG